MRLNRICILLQYPDVILVQRCRIEGVFAFRAFVDQITADATCGFTERHTAFGHFLQQRLDVFAGAHHRLEARGELRPFLRRLADFCLHDDATLFRCEHGTKLRNRINFLGGKQHVRGFLCNFRQCLDVRGRCHDLVHEFACSRDTRTGRQ